MTHDDAVIISLLKEHGYKRLAKRFKKLFKLCAKARRRNELLRHGVITPVQLYLSLGIDVAAERDAMLADTQKRET